jgi:hypothetical protein
MRRRAWTSVVRQFSRLKPLAATFTELKLVIAVTLG